MNVNDLYKLGEYIVNKNQQGYYAPDDFNLTINQGQRQFENFLIGSLRQYQVGRPVASIQYSQNENIRQKITCLIDAPTVLSIDANGNANYPADFVLVDAMYKNDDTNFKVRYAKQDKLSDMLNSTLDPISEYPIYLIQNGKFQFYPKTLGNAKLSYVKKAPEIKWAYTVDPNGLPVYDAGNSINPVWQDEDVMDILARALKMVGVNLDARGISNYANEMIAVGS